MTAGTPEEVRRIFESAAFGLDLGLKLEAVGSGTCTTVLALEPRHQQQDGFVHAGVQATVADHTAGAAAATLLRNGQSVLSTGIEIHLLRAAKGERLVCRAQVLKAGKQLTVVESEVFCMTGDEERLVSKATVTLAVLNRRET